MPINKHILTIKYQRQKKSKNETERRNYDRKNNRKQRVLY